MNQPTTQLEQLHDHYVVQVNIAIAGGCDNYVEELVAEFTAARLQLLQERASPAQSEARPSLGH